MIDTIGTFDDAIAIAGKMGGIKGKPKKIEVREKRRSIFDLLFNKFQQNIGSRIGVEPAISLAIGVENDQTRNR